MRITILLAAATLAACSVTPRSLDSTPVDPVLTAQKFYQPVYSAMDCEMVGSAHKEEIDDHFPALFNHLDRDHDRVIKRQELMAAQVNADLQQRGFLFQQMDQDRNGEVTTEEYRAYAVTAFDLLDRNGDGDLTEAEVDMQSFRKALQP